MDWSSNGSTLLVNVMKRYVNIYDFDKGKFGRELSCSEKTNIIEASYGVVSASEIHQRKLEVFSMANLQPAPSTPVKNQNSKMSQPDELGKTMQAKVATESGGNGGVPGVNGGATVQSGFGQSLVLAGKVEYVKVNEQVTTKG